MHVSDIDLMQKDVEKLLVAIASIYCEIKYLHDIVGILMVLILLDHIYVMYFHACVAPLEIRWYVAVSSSRVFMLLLMFSIYRCMKHVIVDMYLDGWIMMLLLHGERVCCFLWYFGMIYVIDEILCIHMDESWCWCCMENICNFRWYLVFMLLLLETLFSLYEESVLTLIARGQGNNEFVLLMVLYCRILCWCYWCINYLSIGIHWWLLGDCFYWLIYW